LLRSLHALVYVDTNGSKIMKIDLRCDVWFMFRWRWALAGLAVDSEVWWEMSENKNGWDRTSAIKEKTKLIFTVHFGSSLPNPRSYIYGLCFHLQRKILKKRTRNYKSMSAKIHQYKIENKNRSTKKKTPPGC
jgi:hypothetical protein